MGIVRRVEWKLRTGVDDSARALWAALVSLDMSPQANGYPGAFGAPQSLGGGGHC